MDFWSFFWLGFGCFFSLVFDGVFGRGFDWVFGWGFVWVFTWFYVKAYKYFENLIFSQIINLFVIFKTFLKCSSVCKLLSFEPTSIFNLHCHEFFGTFVI